ncbi:MAG: hypothetical protein ACKV0T_21975 [Planctomycetales bacterium]
MPAPIVYKLGGSLLDHPRLPTLVRHVVAQRPNHRALIVVGGGAAADLVRGWDALHCLGDQAAHVLALEAMRLNETLLHRLLPEARLVRNAKQSVLVAPGAIGLLCAACFVRWGEATGHPALDHTWQVTSDSIAAWAAGILKAAELVLLKSVAAPDGQSVEAAAAAGLVDPRFATWAANLPRVSWVNGRLEEPLIQEWLSRSPA